MSDKFPTMESEARPQMLAILEKYGLQITLKTLVDSLEELLKKRGPSISGCLILEALRGLHAGYLRRHEEEEFKEGR